MHDAAGHVSQEKSLVEEKEMMHFMFLADATVAAQKKKWVQQPIEKTSTENQRQKKSEKEGKEEKVYRNSI